MPLRIWMATGYDNVKSQDVWDFVFDRNCEIIVQIFVSVLKPSVLAEINAKSRKLKINAVFLQLWAETCRVTSSQRTFGQSPLWFTCRTWVQLKSSNLPTNINAKIRAEQFCAIAILLFSANCITHFERGGGSSHKINHFWSQRSQKILAEILLPLSRIFWRGHAVTCRSCTVHSWFMWYQFPGQSSPYILTLSVCFRSPAFAYVWTEVGGTKSIVWPPFKTKHQPTNFCLLCSWPWRLLGRDKDWLHKGASLSDPSTRWLYSCLILLNYYYFLIFL